MLEFDWDVENLTHIARHHVAPEDVEFALTNGSVATEIRIGIHPKCDSQRWA